MKLFHERPEGETSSGDLFTVCEDKFFNEAEHIDNYESGGVRQQWLAIDRGGIRVEPIYIERLNPIDRGKQHVDMKIWIPMTTADRLCIGHLSDGSWREMQVDDNAYGITQDELDDMSTKESRERLERLDAEFNFELEHGKSRPASVRMVKWLETLIRQGTPVGQPNKQ